ncbi:glycosyltransferase family 9 protein [Bdellovibrio sp. HCB337]|uniref:glycosyltransferase family 9 protein n=1 Tax=Bdellovibrio sp. HCB337 TaxID=3394358 RepID=UPI0039A57303
MAVTSCRHFSGYKPCGKNSSCEDSCLHKSIPSSYVLIVHLGAIGAVVRATSLLRGIKRKYPGSHVTWVTDAPSDQLLRNHPLIDRVLTTKADDMLTLSALEFDTAFMIDKSLKAAGVLKQTQADVVFGFKADARGGAILPATPAANELWQLGLDNQQKFFVNTKAETQLMVEALELGEFQRDEYDLHLSFEEQLEALRRRQEWLQGREVTIGLNTGCSSVIPYKKLSVDFQRRIIQIIQNELNVTVVLLGGPEDTERNQQIGQGLSVVQSSTTSGLRDGLVSVAACDVVLTGDSLGMHMAISQKKYVVAWFGPTCAQEIDLYGRGEKILSKAACAPCWKRVCDKQTMCYDQVSIVEVIEALKRGFSQCLPTSSSKQPFSEICS